MKNKALWFSILLSCVVLVCMWMGTNNASADVEEESRTRLKDSIVRAAVSCYANEGFYPGSVDYLVDNYGVIIDDRYQVFYQSQGSNLVPEVEVFDGKE
ncbi:MAG: hypothetical protein HUJ57_01865 [Erysipelotrichaceae bacterium]|nr:hypothetical protein [Erysipelotrichaceae bacterium]